MNAATVSSQRNNFPAYFSYAESSFSIMTFIRLLSDRKTPTHLVGGEPSRHAMQQQQQQQQQLTEQIACGKTFNAE
jgi:hypothetical protein